MPLAYLLVEGLAADVRSNLVLEAIKRLRAVNVIIVALVCDGPTTNFAVGSKMDGMSSEKEMCGDRLTLVMGQY